MWSILYTTVTSLVAVVAPRTSKSLRIASVVLKREFAAKWYIALCI